MSRSEIEAANFETGLGLVRMLNTEAMVGLGGEDGL
jgi:hypothetical protein